MAESASDFRDTLVELIDASPPEPMDHPSPDQWIAYHRGKLSAQEEARLQEHLVRCRDCFDLAAGAAAFAETDEEAETAALWRLLRPQLEPQGPPPRNVRENVREIAGRRRFSERFRLPASLAALFFMALVGLAGWNLRQQRDLDALRAPKPNVALVDFAAGERLAAAGETTLAASTGPAVLLFHPAGELPVYRLSFHDAVSGRELWSSAMRLDRDLSLSLQLPEGLRPGRYRLELSDGSAGGAGKVLETHLLRVTEPGRPHLE